MTLLTDAIQNEESAEEIENFFGGMGLPMPEKGEYYEGVGEKFLVFLNDYGLAIRLTPAYRVVREENPHFLKSLFNRKAGKYEIDIDPGLQCPVPEDQVKPIYIMLRQKYGIYVDDPKKQNLAFLPKTTFPIVIDLDAHHTKICPEAAGLLTQSAAAVRQYLTIENPPIPNPQHEKYSELRKIIAQAWPEYHRAPRTQGLKNFMNLCLEYHKRGDLLAPWSDPANDYHGTTQASLKYHKALSYLPRPPHAA